MASFNVDSAVRWSSLKGTIGWGLATGVVLMILISGGPDLFQGLKQGDGGSIVGTLVLGLLFALFGWLTTSAVSILNNPRSHSIYTKMASIGPVDTIVADLEKQVRETGQKMGSFIFTPNYLVNASAVELHQYTDLVWIYKKQTRHSVNFIPTGSTYEVIMHTRDGKEHTMQASCAVVDQVLQTLARGCPWIVAGYSDQLRNLWSRTRGDFIAEVDARRQQYEEEQA